MKSSALLGRPVSPWVRLSPKVSNFVTGTSDRPLTATLNEQAAWRDCASVAVQLTVLVPRGKDVPDTWVQDVLTGEVPPVTVGAVYVTACELPVMPLTVTSAG